MKRTITLFCLTLLLSVSLQAAPPEDGLLLSFWNLENLFDCDPLNGGEEWSPAGEKEWTPERFAAKCEAVGRTLAWMDAEYGSLPDVFAVCEVENADVMKALAAASVLRAAGYGYAHYESPDRRGVDVGLFYRKDRLTLLSSEAVPVKGLRTRDILVCRFDGLTVVVNHHPSKRGGAEKSDKSRLKAMAVLEKICRESGERTVAVGDFNDTPDGPAFRLLEGVMVNASLPCSERGEGSYKWDGRWDMLDQFWVSPDLKDRTEAWVVDAPFLLTADRYNGGKRPLRTYTGKRYTAGVSDHLPVAMRVLSR